MLMPRLGLGFLISFLAAQDSFTDLSRYHIRAQDLPEPYHSSSVANPPKVIPRPEGSLLKAPRGFEVIKVASGLRKPRTMILASNGDVLVSEPDGDRVSVLRDNNGDGVFENRWTLVGRLDQPYGLAIIGPWLYIGNTGSLVRVPYRPGQTSMTAEPERLLSLPTGGHWTRGLLYSDTEDKLYISVGSRANIDEEGPQRAAILRCNTDGSKLEIFASGLRNPVGMAWEPVTGVLWTCVNERDGLGDDLVPDYATEVQQNAFYGWPYSYIGSNPQPGLGAKRPDLVQSARVPDVLFQAHSAALGIAFYTHTAFPEHFRGGAFVAFHGSWNRARRTGYKVVYLPFNSRGHAKGYYEDFLTGWHDTPSDKLVWGRPVGVMVDQDGSLLVSEDAGHTIWRVRYIGE